MPKAKPLFKVDWNAAPSDAIGACFNSDGVGWYWNVKPEIKGNEKHPNFLRWRGPEYGQLSFIAIERGADLRIPLGDLDPRCQGRGASPHRWYSPNRSLMFDLLALAPDAPFPRCQKSVFAGFPLPLDEGSDLDQYHIGTLCMSD